MKYIILISVFYLYAFNSFCQEIKPIKLSKENYVHRKKVFHIIGYSLLGTSAILFARGEYLAKKQRDAYPNGLLNLDGLGEDIWGGITGLASIPFFVIAAHYKNKVLYYSLDKNNGLILQHANLVAVAQPTVTIKLNF